VKSLYIKPLTDKKLNMSKTQLTLDIPSDILEKAKEAGISVEKIKSIAEDFITLELIASMAKLDRKTAFKIDRSIKISAWKKLKKG